jgi:haloalkane dehalogenase
MEAGWLNKNEYPFQHNHFKISGYNLHYVDEGIGETIVFVHGSPSWSFDFRKVIKQLSPYFRCIAPDHIGFGLSEKPENYDYRTQNHSKTLEAFLIEKQLENITMIVHDFGGPIGLNFAIKYPQKIKKLVILNTWLWSSEEEPEYLKLKKLLKSPILPFLYKYFNFSARFILPRSFGTKIIPKDLLKQFTKPFASINQRKGPIAFAKSLLHDQPWFEELWNKRQIIASKPTLFIWGMEDPAISSAYLKKFQGGFSNSKTLELQTCGHFPQEEEAEIVAKSIFEFLKG